jgi:hypothetical protein
VRDQPGDAHDWPCVGPSSDPLDPFPADAATRPAGRRMP